MKKTGLEIIISFCFGILQIYFQNVAAEGANFCGTAEADPEKTCVSIRLPWQTEPIYFCVEKDKIKYRKQGGGSSGHYCGNENKEKALLVATPWDDCPLSSIPDHCVNQECPPQPFNRTCSSVPPPEHDRWACCDKYFCEKGKEEDCKFRILEPQCSSPKNKSNCVAFIDPHGCCPKYQCDGDGKEGQCPSASSNGTYYATQSGRRHKMDTTLATNESNLETDTSATSDTPSSVQETGASVLAAEGRQPPVAMAVNSYRDPYSRRYASPPSYPQTSCVGDFTCPGTMKCCSSSSLYEYPDTPGSASMHAVRGYCVEPAAE